MTTKLGLYAAPVTAPSTIITTFSTTLSLNLEIADEASFSVTLTPKIEIADESSFSTTLSINIEISDSSVAGGAGGIGGEPDTILNLPTYAKASRLRADFYTWDVSMYPPARTVESIGAKVGSAPLASITDFSYNYELDAIGSWSILIPANDERASVITDGTAEIIKLYYEDVGLILTGFIDDYEIVDSETMRVNGFDMMFRMGQIESLWRLDTKTISIDTHIGAEKIFQQPATKKWKEYYNYVMNKFLPGMGYQYESNFPDVIAYEGAYDDNGVWQYVGITPTYQSQTILDILREFNSITGAHFRIHPSLGILTFGTFGDDSGIIIAPIGEDDTKVREEGALVLKSFDYAKTKENLTNMIVVQGSNDSFGIAVELRHSSRVYKVEELYRKYTESGDNHIGLYATGDEDTYELNLIPKDELDRLWTNYTADVQEDFVGSTHIGGTSFAYIGGDQYRRAIAIPFSVTEAFYPTIANVINMGGIGTFQMAIVPKSGGLPDTSALADMQFKYTNYFANRLPGNIVVQKGETIYVDRDGNPVTNNASSLIYYLPGGNPSQSNREFGVITEMFGFMDLGEGGDSGNPWPLLSVGDYYLVIWYSGGPIDFNISGFDLSAGNPASVHAGHNEDRMMLLKSQILSSESPTLYLDDNGNWASEQYWRVPYVIYGLKQGGDYNYAVEGMLAEVVKDNGSGHRVFFIRDIDSIKTYGLRQTTVSFASALDTSEGVPDIVPASDILHDQAQVYLANRKDPFEKLQVTCTGLFRLPHVGQKVRFVYRGMALNENGDYKWLDINSDWHVLSIEWQINNEGLEHTITLTNVPDDIINPRNLTAEFARAIERSNNNLGELQISSRRLGEGIVTDGSTVTNTSVNRI